MNRLHRRVAARDDSGFTLIELMVSMALIGILFACLLTTVLAAQRSAELSQADHTRTEEGRLAVNRVSRELRQAAQIDRVVNPRGTGYDVDAISAVTFRADFNGDHCFDGVAPTPTPVPTPSCVANDPADPEVLSYCHEPAAVAGNIPRLYVVAGSLAATITSCSAGQPILAEEVDGFGIEYRSSEYRLDADADGVTTWEELDDGLPPYGDRDGVLGTTELAHITSVVVHLDFDANDNRELRTQLALRNRT